MVHSKVKEFGLMMLRFEKSLYDLIRGLRNHKGNENAYIENSLKECRAEIRGQDMGMRTSYGRRNSLLTQLYRRQGYGAPETCVSRDVWA